MPRPSGSEGPFDVAIGTRFLAGCNRLAPGRWANGAILEKVAFLHLSGTEGLTASSLPDRTRSLQTVLRSDVQGHA